MDPITAGAKKRPRGRPFAHGHDPRRQAPVVREGDHCLQCDDGLVGRKDGRYGPYLGCLECAFTYPIASQGTVSLQVQAAPTGSVDAIIAAIARQAAGESVNETRVRELIQAETRHITDAADKIIRDALADMQSQCLIRCARRSNRR